MEIKIGDTLTCTETGKTFVAEWHGCTTNYARDRTGNIFSDEGVDIREKREIKAYDGPVFGYLSSDGTTFGGWKDNVHGTAFWRPICGGKQVYVYVRDIYGNKWHGRGAGKGMGLTIRPYKKK